MINVSLNFLPRNTILVRTKNVREVASEKIEKLPFILLHATPSNLHPALGAIF